MDLAYLDRLCKGDNSCVAEFIGLYLQEAPKLFAELEAMAAKSDGEGLAQAAHALYPHVHYIGDARLCALLQRVRERAATKGPGTCAQDVEMCLSLHHQLLHALHKWMATLAEKGRNTRCTPAGPSQLAPP